MYCGAISFLSDFPHIITINQDNNFRLESESETEKEKKNCLSSHKYVFDSNE